MQPLREILIIANAVLSTPSGFRLSCYRVQSPRKNIKNCNYHINTNKRFSCEIFKSTRLHQGVLRSMYKYVELHDKHIEGDNNQS